MVEKTADAYDLIRRLPIWRGPVDIAPLDGGLTNRSYLVRETGRKSVVRLGGDIPVHGIMRFNDHAASHAAAAAGVSPAVLYADPAVLVIEYIDGKTLQPADVRDKSPACISLIAKAHRDMAGHLRGPALAFDIFHVLGGYCRTLVDGGSRRVPELPPLQAAMAVLRTMIEPAHTVFAHNDLVAGNILDDGDRLWLIDWDYAGFNIPLFDIAGLASNNGVGEDAASAMLELYLGTAVAAGQRRSLHALMALSLLREALWGMVSELHSLLDVDYAAYAVEHRVRFEQAYARLADTLP